MMREGQLVYDMTAASDPSEPFVCKPNAVRLSERINFYSLVFHKPGLIGENLSLETVFEEGLMLQLLNAPLSGTISPTC